MPRPRICHGALCLSLVLGACIGSEPRDTVEDECEPEASQCTESAEVRRCESAGGGPLRWSEPVECPEGTYCRPGQQACSGPDDAEQAFLDELRHALDALEEHGAWVEDFPLDRGALWAEIERMVVLGDGGRRLRLEALRRILLAYPVGHNTLYASELGECQTADLYWQSRSRLGACARPHGDDFVITHVAAAGSPLGLFPGDRITAIEGHTGDAMVEHVLRFPVCGNASASEASRRIAAATSALGAIPVGARLSVTRVDGSKEELDVPDVPAVDLDCRDPVGRDWAFNADSWLREDGVAVVRVPRLYPLGLPADASYQELLTEMRDSIAEALQAVASDAEGLVWDVRANTGGLTPIALELVGGMPGAEETLIAHCGRRVPGSEPVALDPATEFDYEVTPVPEGPLAYDGPTAVLIDGWAGSAADYLAWAVHHASDVPLVGTGALGAYGGIGPSIELQTDPAITLVIDPYRCADAAGEPLETRTPPPDVFVELDPADLAQGIDTQLEAAAELVRGVDRPGEAP